MKSKFKCVVYYSSSFLTLCDAYFTHCLLDSMHCMFDNWCIILNNKSRENQLKAVNEIHFWIRMSEHVAMP